MEKHELDAKETVADSTSTNMLKRVVNALKGHKKIVAGAGAALVAGAIVLATLTAQATTTGWVRVTGTGYDAYPEGTEAVADPSTMTSYKQYPQVTVGNTTMPLYDTTQYAGRLWVDKTVTVPSSSDGSITKTKLFDLEDENLDWYTDKVDPGHYEVDMSDNATFMTTISALSSALETANNEPVPLDIVLVLDVSTSMEENPKNENVYYPLSFINTWEPGRNITGTKYLKKNGEEDKKDIFDGYVYLYPEGGSPDDAVLVPYINKGAGGQPNLYLITDKLSEQGTEVTYMAKFRDVLTQYTELTNKYPNATTAYNRITFTYTLLYKKQHKRIDDLSRAVDSFVEAIAKNNAEVGAEGFDSSYMSRISVVKFSGEYSKEDGSKGTFDIPCYKINDDVTNGHTDIVTPLTIYTTGGQYGGENPIGEKTGIVYKLYTIDPLGVTAADCGLTLAKGVLDGEAYYENADNKEPGARAGVQKVVILFTDGNPKHNGGSSPFDFKADTAVATMSLAQQLKKEKTLVYSVAVVDGADPDSTLTNTSQNLDIYLHGVSSNYSKSSGTVSSSLQVVFGTRNGVVSWNASHPTDYHDPDDTTWYQPSSKSWSVNIGSWKANNKYILTSDTVVDEDKTYYSQGDKDSSGEYVYTAVDTDNITATDLPNLYEKVNYYLTAADGDGSALTAAFMKILSQITSEDAGETTATGRDGNASIRITDYLGDYMEFKGLNGILYGKTASTTMFYADGSQRAYHKDSIIIKPINAETSDTVTYSLMPTGTLAGGFALVDSSLLNPPANQEQVSLTGIKIEVSRSSDAKTGDTVTITIPPELLPTVRYYVETIKENGTTTVTVDRNNVEPVRIFYSVGPKTTTVSNVISQLQDQALRSANATNESDRQIQDYKDFMTNAASYQDTYKGIYSFFNNAYTNSNSSVPTDVTFPTDAGTTTVVATLAETNSYYYHVDEPLYIYDSAQDKTVPLTTENQGLISTANLPKCYTCYWNVNETTPNSGIYNKTAEGYHDWSGDYGTYDEHLYYYANNVLTVATDEIDDSSTTLYTKLILKNRDGEVISEYKGSFDDWTGDTQTYYIPNGTRRTSDEVEDLSENGYTLTKQQYTGGEETSYNPTGTAANIVTIKLGENDMGNDALIMYLGNNGRLNMPVYGTLAIDKTFKAATGFTLPEDPAPEAEITVQLFESDASNANELTDAYPALIRDKDGHPVDHVTHQIVSNTANAMFTVTSSETTTYTLLQGETLKITGLPYGASYVVSEVGKPGYKEKVTIEPEYDTSGVLIGGDSASGELGEPISTDDVFYPQTATP